MALKMLFISHNSTNSSSRASASNLNQSKVILIERSDKKSDLH